MPGFLTVEAKKTSDHLDGKPLKDGEKVVCRWGDGSSSSHRVETASGRACLVIKHKGLDVKVPLRDSGLFLMREE